MTRKKWFLTLTALILLSQSLAAFSDEKLQSDMTLNNLDELRWEHRIILALAEGNPDKVVSMLNEAEAEIIDRDIIWFVFDQSDSTVDSQFYSNYQGSINQLFIDRIHQKYFDSESIKAILIGKDGGIKNRAYSLSLLDVFTQIDQMPMRRAEMQSK